VYSCFVSAFNPVSPMSSRLSRGSSPEVLVAEWADTEDEKAVKGPVPERYVFCLCTNVIILIFLYLARIAPVNVRLWATGLLWLALIRC